MKQIFFFERVYLTGIQNIEIGYMLTWTRILYLLPQGEEKSNIAHFLPKVIHQISIRFS